VLKRLREAEAVAGAAARIAVSIRDGLEKSWPELERAAIGNLTERVRLRYHLDALVEVVTTPGSPRRRLVDQLLKAKVDGHNATMRDAREQAAIAAGYGPAADPRGMSTEAAAG
jgi:hypothetical protein